MTLRTWFLTAATISRAAAARQADVPLEDFHSAADDLGYGKRLTYHQIEETIAALADPGEDDDDEQDEDSEDDEDDDEQDEDSENDEDDDEQDEDSEDDEDETEGGE